MAESVMPGSSVVRLSDLREVVLSGPGVEIDAGLGEQALKAVAGVDSVGAALAGAEPGDVRQRSLTGGVVTVLILGLCLFSGEGYAGVLGRLWPLLGTFSPGLLLSGPVSAVALSQARSRLPVAVMRALFEAGAARVGVEPAYGQRIFGLLVTAVDGTVFDVARTDAMRGRFATPSGGRFLQVRVVTLVACGTRRVLGAVLDSAAVSEQALWDRLVPALRVGTLNLADRNFFSMHRWRTASATGAHLVWRVKNGRTSFSARVLTQLSEGSYLVRLRESDAMLRARRKATGDPKAVRLQDITARMVEFTVTLTDQGGRCSFSRFRVLTTLLDPDLYPAATIAACYAERWQVEIAYKTINLVFVGPAGVYAVSHPTSLSRRSGVCWRCITPSSITRWPPQSISASTLIGCPSPMFFARSVTTSFQSRSAGTAISVPTATQPT